MFHQVERFGEQVSLYAERLRVCLLTYRWSGRGEIGNDEDDGDDADDGDDEDDDGSDKDVDRLVFSLCFTLCGNVLGLSANVCLQPTKGLGHIEANLPPLNVEEVPEIFGLSFGSWKTLA